MTQPCTILARTRAKSRLKNNQDQDGELYDFFPVYHDSTLVENTMVTLVTNDTSEMEQKIIIMSFHSKGHGVSTDEHNRGTVDVRRCGA